jgi:DNA-directed RNA polymerase specialized sigma54-like protein
MATDAQTQAWLIGNLTQRVTTLETVSDCATPHQTGCRPSSLPKSLSLCRVPTAGE